MTHFGGYAGGTKESGVLVHVERGAAHRVGLEDACAEVVDESQRRHDQGSGSRQLLAAIWGRVIPTQW